MDKVVIYHIPVCPFSQRVEILLELKGLRDAVDFSVVDITKPRDPALLAKTDGTTALPVLEDEAGRVLKESLVLLRYVDERFTDTPVARQDPFERGIERLMITREGPFGMSGYRFVMNTDRDRREEMRDAHLEHWRWLNACLLKHNPDGIWLFDRFGLAECVFTPLMQRFWFLEYYEDFALPRTDDYARAARWREACITHPAARQVSYDEIVKLYYDYAVGSGNGALPDGRETSSFAFEPRWQDRPMPPRDKYDRIASEAELGLTEKQAFQPLPNRYHPHP